MCYYSFLSLAYSWFLLLFPVCPLFVQFAHTDWTSAAELTKATTSFYRFLCVAPVCDSACPHLCSDLSCPCCIQTNNDSSCRLPLRFIFFVPCYMLHYKSSPILFVVILLLSHVPSCEHFSLGQPCMKSGEEGATSAPWHKTRWSPHKACLRELSVLTGFAHGLDPVWQIFLPSDWGLVSSF